MPPPQTKKKNSKLPSWMRPVSHSDDLPVLTNSAHTYLFLSSYEKLASKDNSAKSVSSEDNAPAYSGANPTRSPRKTWITLAVVCTYLSSSQSSWQTGLKQWNMLTADVSITSLRKRNKNIISFCDMEKRLCCFRVSYLKWTEKWKAFKSVSHGFLGNTQISDY